MSQPSLRLLAAALGAVVLASGCAGLHDQPQVDARPAAARLSSPDLSFVTQAAGMNLYEIEVSQMVMARAASSAVRSYARMLADHHTVASTELQALLAAKGVPAPATLPPDKQARIAQLQRLNGAEFDREYIRITGVLDHRAAITMFEQASRTLADADLRAFASRMLPVLRQHLQSVPRAS